MVEMTKFEESISKEADYILEMREKINKLDLLKHVKEMRALQREHFKNRDENILTLLQQKEKEVDQLIEKIENHSVIDFKSNSNCENDFRWIDCKEEYDDCGECPFQK